MRTLFAISEVFRLVPTIATISVEQDIPKAPAISSRRRPHDSTRDKDSTVEPTLTMLVIRDIMNGEVDIPDSRKKVVP